MLRPLTPYQIESKIYENFVFDLSNSDQKIILYSRHKGKNQFFTPHYIGKDIYIFLAEYDHGLNNYRVIGFLDKDLWLSYWNANNEYQQFKLIDNNDGFFKIQNVGSGLFMEATTNRNNSNQKYLILTNEKLNCIEQLFCFNKL